MQHDTEAADATCESRSRALRRRVLRRQAVALAIAGLFVLLLAGFRYGWANIFPHGWWRP